MLEKKADHPLPSFPEKFNLADYFLYQRLNEGFGNKTALLYGQHRYSYQQVADRSRLLANYFHSIHVQPEQRVYIILPDTPPFAWSLFATLTQGAIVAMGNPAAPAEDLAYVIDYSRTPVVVTTPSVALKLAPLLKRMTCLRQILLVPDGQTGDDPEVELTVPIALAELDITVKSLAEVLKTAAKIPEPKRSDSRCDDIAFWLFTSGSTGRPKAALHSHRDFAFNTEVYAKRTVGYRSDDVTVSVPRLYFGYATGTNLLFPFAVGATVGLFSEHPAPEYLAQAINQYKASVVTNVPTMMGKLLAYQGELDMAQVRFNLSAGEALPPTLLKQFTEQFQCDVYDGIGSAEMFHIYCSNRPGDVKPGSLGRVVEGYEIRILPRDATEPGAESVPVGEVGVMWVKGDSVAHGYFQDREKSWQTFHGHWCCTGDLFRMDEQGYLWFAGRGDDVFKVNGIWVVPQEVEDCILQYEAVVSCAVVPVDEDGLNKACAFIELAKGALAEDTEQLLRDFVRSKLAHYKCPKYFKFVDEMPKNDRGKIDRKQLLERVKG